MMCSRFILFVLVISFLHGCANDLLGANTIIYRGGDYVERWYLNPEYNKKDIPSGTAFYGASAEKIKNRFAVKYYINDGKRSDIEIPVSDMWIISHNGKRYFDQDDDNLFYYEKLEPGEYVKYKLGERYQIAVKDRPLAIKSCDDEGWCKLYPNHTYDFNDIYVKKIILKEPLQPEPHN